MSVSIAFSRGSPFRTPIYKNYLFLISLLVLVAFTLFMVFLSPIEFDNFMLIRPIPDLEFNFLLIGVVVGHFLIALFFEMFVVEQPVIWEWIRRSCFHARHVSKKYKALLLNLDSGHVNLDHVVETGQSSVLNPFAVLNKPVLSKVVANGGDMISRKTRL